MTTCTITAIEMFSDIAMTQIQVLPVLCVVCLFVGQFICFALIAPSITRRANASFAELMQNDKALDQLLEARIRFRKLKQSQGWAEQ